MMEQVRLCAVWPIENWNGSSLNQIQGRTTVRESYSRALEQGTLKERMATVLCEREIILSDCRSGSFEVREVEDLEDAFKVLGLSSVYEQFVSLRADKRS